jgi:uncharacterized protein with beta-barrel porin domain
MHQAGSGSTTEKSRTLPPARVRSGTPAAAALGIALAMLWVVVLPDGARAQGDLDSSGSQNAAQRDMAGSVARVCPALDARSGALGPRAPDRSAAEDQLNIVCANLVFNDPATAPEVDLDGDGQPDVFGFDLDQDQLNAAVQSLNGEELQATQQQIAEVRAVQVSNISARLSAIRAGQIGPGLSLAGLNLRASDRLLALQDLGDLEIVPAQFEDSGFLSRLGLFITGGVTFGDKDSTGEIEGYDFDTGGVTAGADYRVTDSFVVGAAVGYSHFDADFDSTADSPSGQNLDSDGASVSVFGSFYPTDQLFVDAIATVGWTWYDSSRRIVVPSNNPAIAPIDTDAKGDFDALHYGAAANLGYNLRLLGANLTPIVRVEYLRAEIDGFTEDSSLAVNLTYDDQDAESLTTNLGLEIDYPISTPIGVISPSVRAEYVHEFLNDEDGVRITYALDPGSTSAFDVSTQDPDRDYGILGAGLAATFPAGWGAFVDYSTVVGLSDFSIHTVNLGLRREF